MATILKAAGVRYVDFWSLDVEGAELEVLQGMDWSVPVRVLLIERNQHDRQIDALLKLRGFDYVREQRGNRVYANPGFEAAVAALGGRKKGMHGASANIGVYDHLARKVVRT
jgi:hypothetical protein|tara:strand:- start:361 stop:696 length:336 start_codon:yes stop_codon:yes gene_type:complete